MKLTCAQMDVLISFYIEGDLSKALKAQVENHLKNCAVCKAKYDIIKSMLADLKSCVTNDFPDIQSDTYVAAQTRSQQYRLFKNNLSAYIDNELPTEEGIKIKKFTINNKTARKELEDSYNIRRLLHDSFRKCKENSKYDFAKSVLKHLEISDDSSFSFPAIKITVAICLFTILVTSIILLTTSF